MPAQDVYGFLDSDLSAARAAVEQALGIALQPGASAYRGSYFSCEHADGTAVLLQRNWDPLDEDCMEEYFPDMRVLLYVAGVRTEAFRQQLRSRTLAQLLVCQREL